MREALLSDRFRPGYHFAIPEDNGRPGDPNGLFYANGRYHMFYLYSRFSGGCAWGHVSSIDLIHWRSHIDALVVTEEGGALCSGGAFVDCDGTAYLIYSTFNSRDTGCRIAYSRDRHYDTWRDIGDYAIETKTFGIALLPDENGAVDYVGTQDPSNIWKKDGRYYVLTGNYFVLDKFKGDASAPARYRGDWTDLFCSNDLKRWSFLHRFYKRDEDNRATQPCEDAMCPCFLPLPATRNGGESGKHILLFISHTRGAQYYIGAYDRAGDRFIPERHGRFTSGLNLDGVNGPCNASITAPEALIAPDGRLICVSWLPDMMDSLMNKLWSSIFSLPLELWLGEDGGLGIAPIRELSRLEYNQWDGGAFALVGEKRLPPELPCASCHISVEADARAATRFGLKVFALDDGSEFVEIAYDHAHKQLSLDTRRFEPGLDARVYALETAPFGLSPGETLRLDVYIDKSTVEVFANERAMVCRLVYPSEKHSRISLFAEGEALVASLRVAEMMPSGMY